MQAVGDPHRNKNILSTDENILSRCYGLSNLFCTLLDEKEHVFPSWFPLSTT
jgi:hypothetical protein